ncbi:MAG: polyprenyl synthetase family protein, partial [Bacillota bacterium]
MPAVEQAIRESLALGDGMLRGPATHLLDAGGKRLRPALVLLSALCCHYDSRVVVPAAAAVEMIHMATLIHDDIIDNSSIRRGTPTVNSLWGDKTALLTGDYLFARAFMMIAGIAPCALKPLSVA